MHVSQKYVVLHCQQNHRKTVQLPKIRFKVYKRWKYLQTEVTLPLQPVHIAGNKNHTHAVVHRIQAAEGKPMKKLLTLSLSSFNTI